MTLGAIGLGYLALGAVIAIAALVAGRARASDLPFLIVLWPIAAPLVIATRPPDHEPLAAE
ncbi:MAG: hypothetical protein K8W52_32110, partial [Deltaproteobacteria bacterium]|nr:hypothetical protein [Deltaproteobacteria bacterium]